MNKVELGEYIRQRLADRAQRLGMAPEELDHDLDLVRSGLLDSLGFVDLLADLEKTTGREVDMESLLLPGGGTDIGSIIKLFSS